MYPKKTSPRLRKKMWLVGGLLVVSFGADVLLAYGDIEFMVPIMLVVTGLMKIAGLFVAYVFIRDQRDLHHEANTDGLTQVYNRRYFFEQLEERLKNTGGRREERHMSLIMLDLDHFKRLNDSQGHYTGDQVLVQVARQVKNQIRNGDIFARLGGEEFAILLPDTVQDRAITIAERIRASIESLSTPAYKVSASIGVSEWDKSETVDQYYHRVDMLQYAAKSAGRNTVKSSY